ncbi:MAG: hypothetical protein Unbinned2990contig1002_39 [Prokaryotic dsDNA virus sp.]|nr:MAG: hypothetical protein Unbinned2990contig1002_39 [Prokaryotic dsDNA virus sp.]
MNKPIDINADCKFLKDLEDNSTSVNLGMYNLICSKRDLRLYCKGIKPHSRWKISAVKQYFGMNGNKHDLSSKLDLLYNVLTSNRRRS